jgi:hypothetical protein
VQTSGVLLLVKEKIRTLHSDASYIYSGLLNRLKKLKKIN